MIEYTLEDNLLTKNSLNDRYARVVNVRSFSEEDIAEEIADSNMGISKAEALAMAEARDRIILKRIARGDSANLRLFNIHFGIPGTFTEGEYPTEAAVRITPSKEMNASGRKNTLRHVEPAVALKVDYVEDVLSGTTNQFITSGGNVKIFGHNLKIVAREPTEPAVCRVEFIDVENPENVYPVLPISLVVNNPSELLIVAPQMVADESVKLKITTQFSKNFRKPLKDPRSVVFEKTLTVKG
ncbi:MAG: DUF4469 domain-containing protein [Tannerella sp.]|jgi:hypothetical protein|nr:DUF4469 domain-containing protein [Tannerella sp.]